MRYLLHTWFIVDRTILFKSTHEVKSIKIYFSALHALISATCSNLFQTIQKVCLNSNCTYHKVFCHRRCRSNFILTEGCLCPSLTLFLACAGTRSDMKVKTESKPIRSIIQLNLKIPQCWNINLIVVKLNYRIHLLNAQKHSQKDI